MRELEASGALKVRHVSTVDNAADLLTKALPLDAFERHRVSVMGHAASAGAEGGVEPCVRTET